MSARHKAVIYLLIVAAVWGVAPPVIKYTFRYLPPDLFLTYRFLISSVIMIPWLLVAEPHSFSHLGRLNSRHWRDLILGGFLGSAGQLGLLFWGLNLTTSLDGSVINATSPILVAIAGFLFLKEKITRREKIGLFIGFVGSLVIVIQPLFEGYSLFSGNVFGNLLVLTGTLAWVAYVVLTKQGLKHRLSPLLLTTNMFVVGFIVMSLIVIFRYQPSFIYFSLTSAPISAHAGVWYMAALSGTLAYWLYQKAQKLIEASEANVILYLAPLFTFPVAYFWLNEPITPLLITGSLVIAVGVFISEFRRR